MPGSVLKANKGKIQDFLQKAMSLITCITRQQTRKIYIKCRIRCILLHK